MKKYFLLFSFMLLSSVAFAASTAYQEQTLERTAAVTKIIKAPFTTNFMGIYWPHLPNFTYNKNFYVRHSSNGKQWSSWKEVLLMTEGPDENHEPFDYGHLIYTKNANFIQFKTEKVDFSKIKLNEFHFVFIDSRKPPVTLTKKKAKRSIAGEEFVITPRTGWGADESICWKTENPTAQESVTHLFIHHSALNSNIPHEECDDAIRAYLSYHVTTHGWSDIGYNYLACPHGMLFQGRRFSVETTTVDGKEVVTTKDVIGAQVSKYNKGTLGICAIGSYMGEVQPSQELKTTLYRYLLWQVTHYGIDPLGQTAYTPAGAKEAQTLQTILGHKDAPAASTECPGDTLHPVIPLLRTQVAERLKQPPPK
ncbi:MAG: N-acetylmuramoyl-L-alanine amidase [Deltaproteobacteria bacterium]|nr:N-acetylmuramoyl-L-alanine amidase [Deltaproteobacteria bacterium]